MDGLEAVAHVQLFDGEVKVCHVIAMGALDREKSMEFNGIQWNGLHLW